MTRNIFNELYTINKHKKNKKNKKNKKYEKKEIQNISNNININKNELSSYSKIINQPEINNLSNDLIPNTSFGQYYYINNIVSIYNFPKPNLSSPYVISVVSFGGGIYGNIDPKTGLVLNDNLSDVHKYWRSIGMTELPAFYVKFLNNATNNTNDLSSTIENTMDIQTIGGCCPSSNLIIVLYIGPNNFSQFTTTLNYISSNSITHNGINYDTNCISISWGATESKYGLSNLNSINSAMSNLISKNINICVASGDYGSSDGMPGNNLNFPSSSPFCTSVGGTSLYCPPLNGVFKYSNPNTMEPSWSSGGGGISAYFDKPYYQSSINTNKRSSPDIALNADPRNGMYYLVNNIIRVVGGTSCSAPMFAGFLAATNTKFFINPLLYSTKGWNNDVLSGNNGAFNAYVGYDNCSGFGSINGILLKKYTELNTYIILNQINPLNLNVSNTFQAIANVYPITNSQNIVWSSSDLSIASVNSNGLVTAINGGTVYITATLLSDSSIYNSFVVIVSSSKPIFVLPISLTLNTTTTTLYTTAPNNTLKIISNVLPTNSSQIISWSSSNNNIASIDNNGLVKGFNIGTVTITAKTINNISKNITLNVYKHSISLNNTRLTISISKTKKPIKLIATLGNTENGTVVSWNSSNKNFLLMTNISTSFNRSSVDLIPNKSGIGKTVIITAQSNNIFSKCTINIIA